MTRTNVINHKSLNISVVKSKTVYQENAPKAIAAFTAWHADLKLPIVASQSTEPISAATAINLVISTESKLMIDTQQRKISL